MRCRSGATESEGGRLPAARYGPTVLIASGSARASPDGVSTHTTLWPGTIRGVSAAVDSQAPRRLERALVHQGDAVAVGAADPDAVRPGEPGAYQSGVRISPPAAYVDAAGDQRLPARTAAWERLLQPSLARM